MSNDKLIQATSSPSIASCDYYVNVKDFGALGDGIKDDTLAIKNAIDSISIGTIFFPPGTYVVKPLKSNDLQAITMKSNLRILGSGVGITTLKFANSARNNCAVVGIFGGNNVTISSLTIDGNKQRTSSKYDIIGEGIEFNGGTKRFWITDVHIKNTLGEGIDIDQSYDGSINNIVIEDCQGNGLHISTYDPNSERINVSNITIRNCAHGRKSVSTRTAAVVLRGGHLNITNINISDSDRGFHIDGEGMIYLKPIKIVNANVENTTRQAVFMRESAPVTYFTNSSFDGGSDSYSVRAYSEIHFDHCNFSKASVIPACVSIEANATHSSFNHCSFKGGSPSLSIRADGTKITHSTFLNFPKYSLYLREAKNLNITGNIMMADQLSHGVYFQKINHSAFSLNNFNQATLFIIDSSFNHSNLITNNIFKKLDGTIDRSLNVYEHNFIGGFVQ